MTDPFVEHARLRTIGEPTGLAVYVQHGYVVDYDDELWVLDLAE